MLKGYIAKWKKREGAEPIMDYWFTSGIENAAHWRTKEDAEMDCVLFHNLPITIQSSESGFYTIKTFKVEERALGEFVISCEAPFILTGTGEAKVPEARKGYKNAFESFNPVAIKLQQHEVHAPEHTNWGTVTCGSCFEQFAFGPNRIYAVRGNRTVNDYEKILENILSNDHKKNRPHQNAYDLGE